MGAREKPVHVLLCLGSSWWEGQWPEGAGNSSSGAVSKAAAWQQSLKATPTKQRGVRRSGEGGVDERAFELLD